jgi:hypothetical protein
MIKSDVNGSGTLDRMNRHRTRLDELLPRLEDANAACASAARPLSKLADLDPQQRRELAKRLRATIQEWQQVTTQIHQALTDFNTDSAPSAVRQG